MLKTLRWQQTQQKQLAVGQNYTNYLLEYPAKSQKYAGLIDR